MKKFNLTDFQFQTIENFLRTIVKFVDVKDYGECITEAQKISPDAEDVDYFALALKLNCPIWTQEKGLKKQDKVKILSTSELMKII